MQYAAYHVSRMRALDKTGSSLRIYYERRKPLSPPYLTTLCNLAELLHAVCLLSMWLGEVLNVEDIQAGSSGL